MKRFVIMIGLVSGCFAYNDVVCEQVLQDDDKAKRRILSILEKEPEHVQCVLKLANINLKRGAVIEGFELVARAYAIDPHAVKRDSVSKVLPSALKVTQLMRKAKETKDNKSWNKVGSILFEIGIFEEAAKAYEVSLNKDKSQEEERFMFALSLQNSGQIYRAIHEFKQILLKKVDHFHSNYYLGKLLRHETYDEVEAKRYLTKAYEILISSKDLFNKNEYKRYYSDLTGELRRE